MTISEQIIAAAKEAGIKLVPFVVDGNEYDFCDVEMDTSETLERFYAIAHEAGAASRDAEIADLTKQREELEFSWAGCSQQLKDACADLDAVEQERNQLRTELVKALAACKAKDEAILQENYSLALSFQPDDSALKAWLGAPVAWEFTDAFGTHYTDDQRDWMDTPGIESVTRLYSPKGLK